MSGVVETIVNGGKAAFDATSEWVANHPYYAAGIAAFLILPSVSNAVEKFVWPNTVLELDLETVILTHNEPGPWHHIFGEGQVMSVKRLVSIIDTAASDSKVKGMVVRLGSLPIVGGAGLAAIDEIREAVKKFVKQGKVAVAYGDSFGEFSRAAGTYYLATAFSQIYIAPCGDVNLTELALEAPFVRGTLDKLGVLPRVSARKQYKNAANMFTEEKYNEPHKEAASSLLNSLRAHVFAEIAAARNLTVDQVETLFRDGPHSGKDALEKKLIDGLMYRDEVYDQLKTLIKTTPKLLFLSRYFAKKGPQKQFSSGNSVIAYINLVGMIHRGSSKQDMAGTVSSIGSDTVCRAIRAATKDARVKAIILHIDSGGGSYVASDVIAREILLAKKAGKKVISCMSNVAASGGYFISLYADKIVAQPSTITGSIGVLVGKFVTPGFWSKLGVTWDQIHGGAQEANTNAQIFSSLKDYSEDEKKRVEAMLDRIYADFTGKVAVGRKMTQEQVEEVAKGRVWTGLQAKANGLVDEIGGLYTAVSIAKKEAGIPDADYVKIEPFPKPMTLLQKLNRPENSEEQVTAGVESSSIPSVSQVRGALTAPLWASYPLSFFHDAAAASQYDVGQIALKALNASNAAASVMGPLSLEVGTVAM